MKCDHVTHSSARLHCVYRYSLLSTASTVNLIRTVEPNTDISSLRPSIQTQQAGSLFVAGAAKSHTLMSAIYLHSRG